MSLSTGLSFSLRRCGPRPLAVELDVPAGRITALIGPSGSGKTSLLHALAGLLPAHGHVVVDGVHWQGGDRRRGLAVSKRSLGMVFQAPALFPHLSLSETVALAVPGRSDARRIADDWLAQLGLDGLQQRLPSALSGGQQQRGALARALAREPRLLLLDEPFSALDRSARQTMLARVAAFAAERHVAVLMVTHELDEALHWADRIAIMEDGCLLQAGTYSELCRQPATAAVARHLQLGAVVPVRIAAADGETVTVTHPAGLDCRLRQTGPVAPGACCQMLIPLDALQWLSAAGPLGSNQLNARVERCGEHRMSMVLGEALLDVALPVGRWVEPGSWLRLSIDPERVRLLSTFGAARQLMPATSSDAGGDADDAAKQSGLTNRRYSHGA